MPLTLRVQVFSMSQSFAACLLIHPSSHLSPANPILHPEP